MTIVKYFTENFHLKLSKNTKSGQIAMRGPCPKCGGTDRFFIGFPGGQYPKGGFWCRQCGYKGGNLINFLMENSSLSHENACKLLGLDVRKKSPTYHTTSRTEARLHMIDLQYNSLTPPFSSIFKPSTAQSSIEVAYADRITQLIDCYNSSLMKYWDCKYIMAGFPNKYLKDHGITKESAAQQKIGLIRSETSPLPEPTFCLPGKDPVILPKGIVFPLIRADGRPGGLKVRSDEKQLGYKYTVLRQVDQFVCFPKKPSSEKPSVLVESENDAFFLDHLFGTALNFCSLGGITGSFDELAKSVLKSSPIVIIALDIDGGAWRKAQELKRQLPNAEIAQAFPFFAKDPGEICRNMPKEASLDIVTVLGKWLAESMPPNFRHKLAYTLSQKTHIEITSETQTKWEINHNSNENSVPAITPDALHAKLMSLPEGSFVAIGLSEKNPWLGYSRPPLSSWTIAFTSELYSLNEESVRLGHFDLSPFPLRFLVYDAYSSSEELELLHIRDKPVGSVQILEQYEEKLAYQGQSRSIFYNLASANGLLEAYVYAMSSYPEPLIAFIHQYEKARPFLSTPNGLQFDKAMFQAELDRLSVLENMKGTVTEYRKITSLGTLPINYIPFGAVTGRFTARESRSMNIGKDMRKCFSAPKGWFYIRADYHMIQPRIIAATCKDPELSKAFIEGSDYYIYWIKNVLGIKGLISPSVRNHFKQKSLALMYGMSRETFVQQIVPSDVDLANVPELKELHLTEEIANRAYDAFWEQFPMLRDWYRNVTKNRVDPAFAQTVSDRRIPLPVQKRVYRKFQDSKAVNYFAQGSEVETMLDAVISFGTKAREQSLKTYIALMLHDELLLLCPGIELDVAKALVQQCLTDAFTKRFSEEYATNLVEISHASCWGDLK